MPNFDIIKTSEIENSFRNKSIIDTYELNIKKVTEKFKGNLDIDNKKWNIGLIVGRSGTGKTTVAKECFSEYYFEDFEWDNKSVIENMPKDIELSHITKIFNSVGFGTVWSWLKPYFVLSNGEKMRVNLARCILESQDKIVFDDFNIRYHVAFNSIIVPIYQNGTLLGSVQRKISGNPRYINSSGMDRDRALFPFDKVQAKDDKVILVEGLFDAIKAHQEEVTNTVCTFGGYVSQEQASLLGSLARTVVICPDKDASGLKMAYKTTSLLMTFGINVEYTFAPGRAKDFGDVKDFSQLEYHSYWKIKALQRDLKYFMERS